MLLTCSELGVVEGVDEHFIIKNVAFTLLHREQTHVSSLLTHEE